MAQNLFFCALQMTPSSFDPLFLTLNVLLFSSCPLTSSPFFFRLAFLERHLLLWCGVCFTCMHKTFFSFFSFLQESWTHLPELLFYGTDVSSKYPMRTTISYGSGTLNRLYPPSYYFSQRPEISTPPFFKVTTFSLVPSSRCLRFLFSDSSWNYQTFRTPISQLSSSLGAMVLWP